MITHTATLPTQEVREQYRRTNQSRHTAEHEGFVIESEGEPPRYVHELFLDADGVRLSAEAIKNPTLVSPHFANTKEEVGGYRMTIYGQELGELVKTGIMVYTNNQDKVRDVFNAFVEEYFRCRSVTIAYNKLSARYASEKGTGKYSHEPLISWRGAY